MEATVATAVLRPSFVALKSGSSVRSNRTDFVRFASPNYQFSLTNPLGSKSKPGHRVLGSGSRKWMTVRASSSSESTGSAAPIAPLQLESPVGQLLSQILISHPYLLPAAVEKQLEQLQTDRDAEEKKEDLSASGTDLVLYRRIAEVKANERRRALEEILYASVVQKFMDANVSLIPAITPSSSDPSGRIDKWPSQDDKLEMVHSPEAYEMIESHLALIMGNRLADSTSVAQISRFRVGQVYAASVMYGYFLKRVDQRFQLEKAMKLLPDAEDEESDGSLAVWKEVRPSGAKDSSQEFQPHPEVSSWSDDGVTSEEFENGIKASRLRNYVMSFDGESIHRYASIRSKESVSIIEKHTEALFGRPTLTPKGTVDPSKDELIRISFGGLKRLVLEAVTFGSFLWDVESYVDSKYHFVVN